MKNKIYIILMFLLVDLLPSQAQEHITVDDVITGKTILKAQKSIVLQPGFHAVAGADFHAYIDPDASAASPNPTSTATTSVTVGGTSTTTSQNYIRSIAFREPHSSIPSGSYAHTEEIQYFDGLGRPSQIIQVDASPKGHDIVQPIVYDDFGREAKKYLPYIDINNNGAFVENAVSECVNFYKTANRIEGKEHDSNPFAFTRFENSPLNRVESQLGAGSDWHTKNKAVNYKYTTNTETVSSWDEERRAFSYRKYSLYVTEIMDENGHVTKEYKDKLGQVILKESMNESETLRTHYIYDDFGLLRIVVPPLADSPEDEDLCYYYCYDGRKRMISKKIPGAEIVNMVYDYRDRLVLTQDGNMRAENGNKYLFTKYDQLNRPVLTGTIVAKKSLSELRTDFDNYGDVSSEKMYEEYQKGKNKNTYGYTTSQSYPSLAVDNNTIDILTVTWYDDKDYDFIENLGYSDELKFNSSYMPDGYEQNKSSYTKGVAIGSMVKALPVGGSGLIMANTTLVTVSYFDKYGNVIMIAKTNHKGGVDRLCSKYKKITHEVEETTQVHKIPNQEDLTVVKGFKYDHMGRLLETTCKVNNQDKFVLNASRYNELGELVTKYLHSEDASNSSSKTFVQEVNYRYNIRGWLTSINDPDLSEDNDLFGMKLYYNNLGSLNQSIVPTASQQFNGNIAAMVCGTMGENSQVHGFGYDYDSLNRLKYARYGEGSALANNKNKNNVSDITYDKNGNIQTLKRYFNGMLADDLTYTYENTNEKSNRLKKVTDPAGDITAMAGDIDLADFKLEQPSRNYEYDDAGNMKYDPSRGMVIKYNFLNLPQEVKVSDTRKIFYHYDAAGNKLAKYINDDGTYKSTDYVDNLVYTDGKKSFFSTEEGRAVPIKEGDNTRWHFEYNLKDHLGNTRVVFGGSMIPGGADIVQTSSYYPFGMVMAQKKYNTAGANYQQNKYLYNGKELQDDDLGGVSLDWYDYGARFYDPAIGRWNAVDPLAEKYLNYGPYVYAINNPILFIDPDGMRLDLNWILKKNKEGEYKRPELAQAFLAFAQTDLGSEYLSLFAEKGQEISELGVKYEKNGALHDKGFDLSFAGPTEKQKKRGDYGPNGSWEMNNEGGRWKAKIRLNTELNVGRNDAASEFNNKSLQYKYGKNNVSAEDAEAARMLYVASRAGTIIHELVIHGLEDIDAASLGKKPVINAKLDHDNAKKTNSRFRRIGLPAVYKVHSILKTQKSKESIKHDAFNYGGTDK
ncbi:DUF6443 domain-containing protein [Saccharicrinis fermentans]|uniref:RHS repeat-associated core domain protein n=1 Tax=Saccharicrinis fermentans DSM 9555 = JCM 21142 TaxID=869213 RepID=W7YDJ6_9BACT|nr:DUF6443 domain-containing protein [Saccharicrinis fermentans]GAF05553.1 RHS repeat-associated core domain protein [Saccharicrinis fermentans DSM 9555 = JCM 21142]